MAELVKSVVSFSDVSAAVAFTQPTGSDFLTLDNADGRVTVLIRNGNAQNAAVTLRAGDGALSSLGDVAVTAGASQTVAVPFARAESARVKVTGGADRGKVFVDSSVDAGGSLANVGIAVLSVE